MGAPRVLIVPPAAIYVLLKLYEDFFLDGQLLLPLYINVLLKITPIFLLMIWTIATDFVGTDYQMYSGLALVFSMGGDTLLELHHFKHHFVLGLGSFLIAHLFYVASFFGKPKISVATVFGAVFMGALVMFLGNLFGNAAPPELSLPVMVYCGVIGTMLIMAILCASVPRREVAIAGAIVFAISDSSIALEKFIMGGHAAGARAFIMLTYYMAQYLLTAGYEIDLEEEEMKRQQRVIKMAKERYND